MTNKIYPCLWFDGNGKEAADLYCSLFKDSKITTDTPMVVNFEMSGQKFMCLNGGPHFKINPSISIFVVCETEEETDRVWQKLNEGGKVLMPLDKYPWSEKYGWVEDRFGVNWQLAFGKLADVGQKFTPCLMFVKEQVGRAEEAINFYTSVFENSGITGIMKYSKEDEDIEGFVKHAQFNINGYVLMAMDSSADHKFEFNEGFSIVVECKDQQEIDYFWNKLTEGGAESQCGWLEDKFGVSWQIIPANLGALMSDPERGQRAMNALMKMKKLDIKTLENA